MAAVRIARVLTVLFLAATLWPAAVARSAPLDYDVEGGHFYTQANGQGGNGGLGYAITNGDGIPFWSEFQRLGGVSALGYPVSHRFLWKGTIVQALQKSVLQWQSQTRQVVFVNVFDDLRAAGKDTWLLTVRSIPGQNWLDDEAKLSWNEIVSKRLAFLDEYPALRARFNAARDPLSQYGLPASRVRDMGNHFVIRLQRAAMQQWKVDVPWAKAGEVTVVNGGDIAKEAGMFPAEVVKPLTPGGATVSVQPAGASQPAPPAATAPPTTLLPVLPAKGSPVVALDPGHGGTEVGASHSVTGSATLREKDLNLQVAQRTAAILREAGFQVVLTRAGDSVANVLGGDANGDGEVGLEDDLQTRIDVANRAKAAVLISIHHNGGKDRTLRGSEVYFNPNRPYAAESRRLAQLVLDSLAASFRAAGYTSVSRGVKQDIGGGGRSYFVLGSTGDNEEIKNPSQMPAALSEALFLTNDEDAAALRRPATVEAEAQAFAVAISQFLGTRQ